MADDEPSILEAGRAMLTQAGYRVRTATSGETALRIHQEMVGETALMILDLGMPGMGGMLCLEEVLRRDPGQRVIVASGYSPSPRLRELLLRPTIRFIQKPYRFGELLRTMRDLLQTGGHPG